MTQSHTHTVPAPAFAHIQIQGLKFTVPSPYAEGHVLTANQAAALNGLLGENLRNNFAKKVAKALEAEGATPESVHAGLQAELTAYAEGYEFGIRRAAAPTDPVSHEALKIAKSLIREKLRAAKQTADDEIITALAEQLVEKNPSLREEATSRIENTRALAALTVLGGPAAAE